MSVSEPSISVNEDVAAVKQEVVEDNGVLIESLKKERDFEVENELLRSELDTVRAHNEALEDNNLDLRAQLAAKSQTEKDLQEQLKVLSQFAINNGSSHQKQVDLQRMYDQMCYKDGRIVELNNIITDKERQIMDLQEMCREQNQVAEAKNRAVQIVNKRLKDLDNRKFSDASTETDLASAIRKEKSTVKREISPGRAVPQLRLYGSNHSPPPIDPSEEQSSFTTETATNVEEAADADREWSSSPTPSGRKYRKKVTFDLRAASVPTLRTPQPGQEPVDQETLLDDRESLAQAVVDLSAENDQLRKTIAEMEKNQAGQGVGDVKIAALEEEAELARKDGRNQAIKARAAATARLKALETELRELKINTSKEIDSLKASNEVLKSSREWALMENSKLLEQISKLKQKLSDLHGELDASNAATNVIRQRLEAEERRYQGLTEELRNANAANQQLVDEKSYLVNEIERLNDDLNQQADVISSMEGDLIVYEAHVAILRESLSMTKKEEQQLIKSKAFAAKLSALEQEKAVISKRNNDEKIRTKALNTKIRELEKERDSLVESIMYTQGLLQQYEDSKGSGRRTMSNSIDGSECGEPKRLRKIDEDLKNTERNLKERGIDEDYAINNETDGLGRGLGQENLDNSVHEDVSPEMYQKMVPEFARATVTPMVPIPIKFQSNSAFQPISSQLSRETLNSSTTDLESRIQRLKNENEAEKEQRRRLEQEIGNLKISQSEVAQLLKEAIENVLQHLRENGHTALAENLNAEVRNYLHHGDLRQVASEVRRFIDEVLKTLVDGNIGASRSKESNEISRHIKTAVDVTYEDLKHQQNAEDDGEDGGKQEERSLKDQKERKIGVETPISQNFNSLEEEVVYLRDSKLRLQQRLNEADKKALEMIIEREELQNQVQHLQAHNVQLSAELEALQHALRHEQALKAELDGLVEQLRSDNDRLRIEADLSRNCLEDLRASANWTGHSELNSQPIRQLPDPQLFHIADTTAQEALNVHRIIEEQALPQGVREEIQEEFGGLQQGQAENRVFDDFQERNEVEDGGLRQGEDQKDQFLDENPAENDAEGWEEHDDDLEVEKISEKQPEPLEEVAEKLERPTTPVDDKMEAVEEGEGQEIDEDDAWNEEWSPREKNVDFKYEYLEEQPLRRASECASDVCDVNIVNEVECSDRIFREQENEEIACRLDQMETEIVEGVVENVLNDEKEKQEEKEWDKEHEEGNLEEENALGVEKKQIEDDQGLEGHVEDTEAQRSEEKKDEDKKIDGEVNKDADPLPEQYSPPNLIKSILEEAVPIGGPGADDVIERMEQELREEEDNGFVEGEEYRIEKEKDDELLERYSATNLDSIFGPPAVQIAGPGMKNVIEESREVLEETKKENDKIEEQREEERDGKKDLEEIIEEGPEKEDLREAEHVEHDEHEVLSILEQKGDLVLKNEPEEVSEKKLESIVVEEKPEESPRKSPVLEQKDQQAVDRALAQGDPQSLEFLREMAETSLHVAEYLQVQYQLMKEGKLPIVHVPKIERTSRQSSVESLRKSFSESPATVKGETSGYQGLKLKNKENEGVIKEKEEIAPIKEIPEKSGNEESKDEWSWEEEPKPAKPTKSTSLKAKESKIEPKKSEESRRGKEKEVEKELEVPKEQKKVAEKAKEEVREVEESKKEAKEVPKKPKAAKKLVLGKPKFKVQTEEDEARITAVLPTNFEDSIDIRPHQIQEIEDTATARSGLTENTQDSEWKWGNEEEIELEEPSQAAQSTQKSDEWGWGEEEEASEMTVKNVEVKKTENKPKQSTDWAWNEDSTEATTNDDDDGAWEDW
ncbi:unnamed protein product [Bursaphelenchus xylophilus]|uniref:(pine wood nematode) hypothetical protein n=1 Tax=Bursaphelenchus xylophilus TaxID=6326 RepID=A0A1I7S8Q8_BURXY|nr:unnamed protein product [Bursaphelenchus xylophilus]CAG9089313.1 unnamed protein product [Bursaphelenchus xylophilus]